MTGVLEAGALAGLGYLGYAVATEKRRREHERLSVVKRLHRQVLRCEVDPRRPRARVVDPPAGQDQSAAAALAAVQRWQDVHDPEVQPAQSATPSCSVGLLRIVGTPCGGSTPTHRVETVICENLKPWLLTMASGAAAVAEVAARLEFCRQLLMRPEILPDASFVQLIAEVCQHLDQYVARVSRDERTCALELGKLLRLGRQIVDLIMPLLIFALTDCFEDATVPHVNVANLVSSAQKAASPAQAENDMDVIAPFWKTMIGQFLQLLFATPHFLELWKPDRNGCSAKSRRPALVDKMGNAVEEKWLELTTTVPLQGSSSGFADTFEGDSDLQLSYLDLLRNLDNFIKFLSIFDIFKALANREGDAAMHKLRVQFHQMLRELDGSLQKIRKGFATVGHTAKHSATTLVMSQSALDSKKLLWIERLQNIDDKFFFDKACAGFMEAIHELYYLSSAARAPELETSCRREFQKLLTATESLEFRSRCLHGVLGLPDALAEPDNVPEAVTDVPEASLALEDGAAVWSVERQFRLDTVDVEGEIPVAEKLEPLHCRPEYVFATIGEAVASLNSGVAICEDDLCLVKIQHHGEQAHVMLYKAGAKERALIEAGLVDAAKETEEDAGETSSGGPPEQQLARPKPREVSEDEEDAYYELLLMQVCPFFGESDVLERGQATVLFERSELEGQLIHQIMKDELGNARSVDQPLLRRLGRRVALEQAGESAKGTLLPVMRGLQWDGRRLRVMEAF